MQNHTVKDAKGLLLRAVMIFKCVPHFRSKRAGVRALQLFSGDNWFWNRPEMRAGRRGLTALCDGVRANFRGPRPFNYCSARAQDASASCPGKLKPRPCTSCCHRPPPHHAVPWWIFHGPTSLPRWPAAEAGGTAAGAISRSLSKPPSRQPAREGCTDTDKSKEVPLVLLGLFICAP